MTAGKLAIAFAVLLGGCANLNSIHRTYAFGGREKGGRVLTVDAKQRHLLITPEFVGGQPNGFRICAEAAPDVFSAYASSLGVDVGLGATERNGKLASAIAETAATVERTQTINLLRESMYRTCERYLSGALDKDQFIIQSARDQRAMVSVLAIEQLTGVVRPKPTIISGPATSAAIIDGSEAAKLIERFQAEEASAKTSLAAADAAYASARKSGKCDAIADKPAADAKDPTVDEWTACKAAETMVAQRKEDLKAATARLDNALALAADFVSRSNASTTAGTNDGAAYGGTPPGDGALIAVANAVVTIATSQAINEPLMFCIAYLQKADAKHGNVVDACATIISRQAESDLNRQKEIQRNLANVAGYRLSLGQGTRLDGFMQRLFAAINASAPATLEKKMATFEGRAGVDYGLAAACASTVACRDAANDSDLTEAYLANETRLEDALRRWDQP